MKGKDVKFIIKRENPPKVNELNNLKKSAWKKSKKNTKPIKPVNKTPKKSNRKKQSESFNGFNNINKKTNSNKKTIRHQKPVNNSPKKLIEKNVKKKLDKFNKMNKKTNNSNMKNVITSIKDLQVASILDSHVHEWFKHEFNLIPIGPNDWAKRFSSIKPHLLLVSSAWHGNNDKWIRKIAHLDRSKDSPIKKLVQWCKKNKIPTVFWNKEDPYHFEGFLGAAKLFDYIFTTDSNSVSKYKKHVNHNNVFTLPFAAQPNIHNPVNKDKERLGKVVFAGSWYNKDHEDRKKDMQTIINPAMKYNVHIYDRCHKLTDKNFKYPNIYHKYIRGGLTYNEMIKTYKKYDILLNVNIIQKSPTMFSCRIFEALGCGVPIISGYALGIKKMFPRIVKMSKTVEETEKHLKHLINNKNVRDRLALLGIREINAKHTYKHRVKFLLDKIGFRYKEDMKAGVSIIVCVDRDENIDNIFKNYSNQFYKNKELIIVINKNNMNLKQLKDIAKNYTNVRVFKLDKDSTLEKSVNFAVNKSKYDYISLFEDSHYYGPNFITDLMNAFNYSKADVVGKNSYFVYYEDNKTLALRLPSKENSYTKVIVGSAMIFKKKLLKIVKFSCSNLGEKCEFISNCLKHNIKLYSTDRFNYIYISSNSNTHSWNLTEKEFLKHCEIIKHNNNYKEHVTI